MIRLRNPDDRTGTWASMPDGRSWGPFETDHAAERWKRWFSDRAGDLVTAQDLYEGSVSGDGAYLISEFAVQMDTHPLVEINDVLTTDDNGKVVFDLSSRLGGVEKDVAVLVDNPQRHAPARRLSPGRQPPRHADCRVPSHVMSCSSRGEIVVLQDGTDYLVAWRADGRATRSLPVLSLHTVEACALKAARGAAKNYEPAPRRKSSRIRDYQREQVYRWEARLEKECTRFETIDECRDYAAEICAALGLPVPNVSVGRASLQNHSYFSPLTGIVLQKGMMNNLTLLHEIGHYAVYKAGAEREAAHGPRFAGTLAALLSAFADTDLETAITAARAADLDIDEDLARRTAEAFKTASYRP